MLSVALARVRSQTFGEWRRCMFDACFCMLNFLARCEGPPQTRRVALRQAQEQALWHRDIGLVLLGLPFWRVRHVTPPLFSQGIV